MAEDGQRVGVVEQAALGVAAAARLGRAAAVGDGVAVAGLSAATPFERRRG